MRCAASAPSRSSKSPRRQEPASLAGKSHCLETELLSGLAQRREVDVGREIVFAKRPQGVPVHPLLAIAGERAQSPDPRIEQR